MNNEIIEWKPEQMLEIQLSEPDDFLKVKETLTRIGIASKSLENTLFQSCHILHKRGRYFIVHFKELFALDGKPATLTRNDLERRNSIAQLLSDWGLVVITDPDAVREKASLAQIKIIPFKDKKSWVLSAKYTIGRPKFNHTNQ